MKPSPFVYVVVSFASVFLAMMLWMWLGNEPAWVRPFMRVGAVVFLVIMTLGILRIGLGFFGPVVCRGPRTARRVALTYDDGPDPAITPQLLAMLAAHEVRATFFCVGKQVVANPHIARQMAEAGHLLGNHTYSHAWTINFAREGRWRRELAESQRVIGEATGQIPKFMRPPMGLTNPHLHQPLRELGLTLLGWDVRSFDTLGESAERVIQRVVKKTQPGSIILLHDAKLDPARTLAISAGIIDALKSQGYELVRVDELLG